MTGHEFNHSPFEVAAEPNWSIEALRLKELACQYEKNRFVVLPQLLQSKQAQALLDTTLETPVRRVICGDKHVSWDEQTFTYPHPAYQFLQQDMVVGLIGALTAKGTVEALVAWTSGYKEGEYINPHQDGAGTIQLLTCLSSPLSAGQGGELVVGGSELFLRPGDAVAFEATTLEHYTTPFAATELDPDPRRVVLVGRYFLS